MRRHVLRVSLSCSPLQLQVCSTSSSQPIHVAVTATPRAELPVGDSIHSSCTARACSHAGDPSSSLPSRQRSAPRLVYVHAGTTRRQACAGADEATPSAVVPTATTAAAGGSRIWSTAEHGAGLGAPFSLRQRQIFSGHAHGPGPSSPSAGWLLPRRALHLAPPFLVDEPYTPAAVTSYRLGRMPEKLDQAAQELEDCRACPRCAGRCRAAAKLGTLDPRGVGHDMGAATATWVLAARLS